MREDHGPVKLVTDMPEVEIREGVLYVCARSGGERFCIAAPVALAMRVQQNVDATLGEHFRTMGKVVPLKE